jgi:hypothetical protein
LLLKFSLLKIATCVERYGARFGEQFRDLPLRVSGVQSAGKSGDQLSVDSRRDGAKSGVRCVWQCVWLGA